MEVKLGQLQATLPEFECVAVGEAKLDSVAVVDDGVGTLAPTDLQRRCRAAMAPVMSIGDCWPPVQQAASAASRPPHFSGSASPL
jgi:hypothetical protein